MNSISNLMKRYPILEKNKKELNQALEILLDTVNNNGVIYSCGNGGSFSDSQHLVGELLKSFNKKRPVLSEEKERFISMFNEEGKFLADKLERGISATALGCHDAYLTAFANDVEADLIFAQELFVRGNENDILLCLSTSGNSKNVKYAAMVAKFLGIKVILLCGKNVGTIEEYSDCSIHVDEYETYKIQELCLPIYHALCLGLEDNIF